MAEPLEWNVAVYCASEAARLQGCLESIATALVGRRALITVIVNGSSDRSLDIACTLARRGAPIEIFEIATADKSNAINQFHHVLRSPAGAYANVDGYVRVAPDSFRAFEERLSTDRHALALTGIAGNGRSMEDPSQRALTLDGNLQGQLHAFRPDFLDRMVRRGMRLPVGLYRGDGLLGSMAAHDLDPLAERWDNTRLVGVEAATFLIPTLSPFRLNDVRRQWRRLIRQMRGQIEYAAIKQIIYHAGYEALPGDANEMIRGYLAKHPPPAVQPQYRAFQRLAIRHSMRASAFDPQSLSPTRIHVA